MASLIVADAWKNFPLVALIALAALQAVPKDIKAAAVVDGAGAWSRFRFVLWPYLAGPLMVALVLRTIEGFKVFDIIWVMTRGGPANSTRSPVDPGLPGGLLLPARGLGRLAGADRHADHHGARDLLHHRHPAERGEGLDPWNTAAFRHHRHPPRRAAARRLRAGAARLAVPDEHLLAAGPHARGRCTGGPRSSTSRAT